MATKRHLSIKATKRPSSTKTIKIPFPWSLVNKSAWHESLHQATSRQQDHDDQSKGSSHLVLEPCPRNHGTYSPWIEDIGSWPTIYRISSNDQCSLEPRVITYVPWNLDRVTTHVPITSGDDPHVHLHERSSTPFQQRSGEPTSPINSQGLYLAEVHTS